jgi:hypothetical protein
MPPPTTPARHSHRITPELKRIMQQDYLDHFGFWKPVPHAGSIILKLDYPRGLIRVLKVLLVALAFGVPFGLFWWILVAHAGISPLALEIMAGLALAGIFVPGLIARSWDFLKQWRAGPWLTIDTLHSTIHLPRHNLRIATKNIQWSVLYSELDLRCDGKSSIAEFTLTLGPNTPDHTCISLSAGYGRRGLRDIDRKAATLAQATHAPLIRSGYPPNFTPTA